MNCSGLLERKGIPEKTSARANHCNQATRKPNNGESNGRKEDHHKAEPGIVPAQTSSRETRAAEDFSFNEKLIPPRCALWNSSATCSPK